MEGDGTFSAPSNGVSDDVRKRPPLHGRTTGPTRRSTKGQWTAEEDEILCKAVQRFKGKNWKKIAECFKDRSDVQCLHRWQKVLNPELVKGPWSKEEDEQMIQLVSEYGPKKWSTIAQHLPGRIGKQCRERWHNHLNPAISKGAWTQDEELTLIRAHQIYGNKWAELTKFLPGRTDNAIKNHWNGSVKKKLDSYLASGLLSKFQALPHVEHQSQFMPSSRIQNSGHDSVVTGGTEAEEISECSQDSAAFHFSLSSTDIPNVMLLSRGEFQLTEESNLAEEQNSAPSCAEEYYTSLENATFSLPDKPSDLATSSSFLGKSFSHDAGTSSSGNHQFSLHNLHSISSLGLEQELTEVQNHCISANKSHGMVNVSYQTSVELASTSVGHAIMVSDKSEHMLISDDDCGVLYSETTDNKCFSSGNHISSSNMVGLGGLSDSLLSQSSNPLISKPGFPSSSQAPSHLGSYVLGTSFSHSLMSAPLCLSAGRVLTNGGELDHLNQHSFETEEQDIDTISRDGFIYTDDNGMQQQPDLAKNSSKLFPLNTLGKESDATRNCIVDERSNLDQEQQDTGSLCYEPPRFPSPDIPFCSCDLVQSGSDMHQEYSPLGIRQLMISSSMNCVTPFRLWDSPSRDGSPDAVLKSAAKTFKGTPSILKKRNRELFSPLTSLSDRKLNKKLETDTTSCLARDFSRLDVIFSENETDRDSLLSPSTQQRSSGVSRVNKENTSHPFEGRHERNHTLFPDENISLENVGSCDSLEKKGNIGIQSIDSKTTIDVNNDAAAQIVQQSIGILVEHDVNDPLLFSPIQNGFRAGRTHSSVRKHKNRYHKILGSASKFSMPSKCSSGNSCSSIVISPSTGRNKSANSVAVTSVQSVPSSAPLETTSDNAGNDTWFENFSLFGDTPIKRSIESPSTWKSPWFINSFLPGPRIDTEITIEDIGYFMSPGEKRHDALGLMKQLDEHTASAYADALEVLGNDTPESLLKGIQSDNSNLDLMMECRVLDFSERGTHGKGEEED